MVCKDHSCRALAGIAGGVALLFSHPAVLVAALVGAILLVGWWSTRPRPPLGPVAALLGGWTAGAAIATAAAIRLRDPETLEYMQNFWGSRGGFPPALTEGLGAVAWAPRQLFEVFAHFLLFITPLPLVVAIAVPSAALALLGLFYLCRRFPWATALVTAPIAAGLFGAFTGLLPFRHRLGLYAGWSVLALSMAGLQALRMWLPGRGKMVAGILAALVAAPLAFAVLFVERPPYTGQESRPVLQEIARRYQPTDALYIYCGGRHAIAFYAPRVNLASWTQGGCHEDPRSYLRELDAFRGQARLWFFFMQSHGEETAIILSYLRTIGRERDVIPDLAGSTGEAETGAYLFDLSDPHLLKASAADTFSVNVKDADR